MNVLPSTGEPSAGVVDATVEVCENSDDDFSTENPTSTTHEERTQQGDLTPSSIEPTEMFSDENSSRQNPTKTTNREPTQQRDLTLSPNEKMEIHSDADSFKGNFTEQRLSAQQELDETTTYIEKYEI